MVFLSLFRQILEVNFKTSNDVCCILGSHGGDYEECSLLYETSRSRWHADA
jgi:hypothetical protein